MNWIDYTVVTVLFFFAMAGLFNGPVTQLIKIVCVVISFFVAFIFFDILSNILQRVFTSSMSNLLSYFVIFGVAFIITHIVTDIIKKILRGWDMGFGLRLFGALLGGISGLVFCGAVIFGVLLFSSKPTIEKVNTSKIANRIGEGMQAVVSLVPPDTLRRIRGYKEDERNTTSDDKNLSKDFKSDK